jgi:hypothetical protein
MGVIVLAAMLTPGLAAFIMHLNGPIDRNKLSEACSGCRSFTMEHTNTITTMALLPTGSKLFTVDLRWDCWQDLASAISCLKINIGPAFNYQPMECLSKIKNSGNLFQMRCSAKPRRPYKILRIFFYIAPQNP